MSSIRLYILGVLANEGEMHGHQIRQLADKEYVTFWTDISVGALYGALKRLAGDGLIEEARIEREGGYPERQIWRITAEGRAALARLREEGLSEVVFRPDPFDLAMSRLDQDRLDELPAVLELRLQRLREMLAHERAAIEKFAQNLSANEKFVARHRDARLAAEITWHESLLEGLPEILADEKKRQKDHRQ
ncbi:MAG: PadR family transcriptional regulator [Acidovorax sp.]